MPLGFVELKPSGGTSFGIVEFPPGKPPLGMVRLNLMSFGVVVFVTVPVVGVVSVTVLMFLMYSATPPRHSAISIAGIIRFLVDIVHHSLTY